MNGPFHRKQEEAKDDDDDNNCQTFCNYFKRKKTLKWHQVVSGNNWIRELTASCTHHTLNSMLYSVSQGS